jgi:hypothetical protein
MNEKKQQQQQPKHTNKKTKIFSKRKVSETLYLFSRHKGNNHTGIKPTNHQPNIMLRQRPLDDARKKNLHQEWKTFFATLNTQQETWNGCVSKGNYVLLPRFVFRLSILAAPIVSRSRLSFFVESIRKSSEMRKGDAVAFRIAFCCAPIKKRRCIATFHPHADSLLLYQIQYKKKKDHNKWTQSPPRLLSRW